MATPYDPDRNGKRFHWKDFLYFSQNQRRAILLLCGILLPALLAVRYRMNRSETEKDQAVVRADSSSAGYGFFISSPTDKARSTTGSRYAADPHGHQNSETYRPKTRKQAETFPFDPNTADSLSLRRLGLPPYVVRNLLRYRRAGGIIRTPEKLAEIYGMAPEDYRRIAPYARIAEKYRPKTRSVQEKAESAQRKTQPSFPDNASQKNDPLARSAYPRIDKYPSDTVLDLNTTDTFQLKRLHGIGSYRARAIVRYRTRLGGYSHVEQLREIPSLPDSLLRNFRIGTPPRRILEINRLSFKQLLAHPYLNYAQVRIIVEHRRKHGPFRSLRPLQMYDEFSETDLNRLAPYVRY